MIEGDLATMPLADLLQWVDATRKTVSIEIGRADGLTAWLTTHDRHVVSASAPAARGVLTADGTPSAPGPALRALAIEGLLDLFAISTGRFALREGEKLPTGGITVQVQLGFLVMEGLRQLDEWPRIEATYPDDAARLRAVGQGEAAEVSVVQAAILRAARDSPTLGEIRLVLGLSRLALLRRVDELRSIGLVEVEGSVARHDLPSTLVDQAMILIREEQFAEAAHVLRSLLASTPGDMRLHRLLAETERRHIESCYATIDKADLVKLASGPPRQGIAPQEQALVDALNAHPRSVAGLVLVSPLRELETLVGVLRLAKKGVVVIEPG